MLTTLTNTLTSISSQPIIYKPLLSQQEISLFDKNILESDLINKIASLNVTYLAIVISIILGSGFLSYFFGIRPIQKEVEKDIEDQKINLLNLTSNIETRFNSTKEELVNIITTKTVGIADNLEKTREGINLLKTEAFEKISTTENKTLDFIQKAEQELLILRKKYQETELDNSWNEFYMWEGRKVYINCLTTLIEWADKSSEYDMQKYLNNIWVARLKNTLNTLEYKIVTENKKNIQDNLLRVLSTIEISDTEKNELKPIIENL